MLQIWVGEYLTIPHQMVKGNLGPYRQVGSTTEQASLLGCATNLLIWPKDSPCLSHVFYTKPPIVRITLITKTEIHIFSKISRDGNHVRTLEMV